MKDSTPALSAHKTRRAKETPTHWHAKKTILDLVNSPEPHTPQILRHCAICNREHIEDLPDTIERADLEVRLDTRHIADVALFTKKGRVGAAIEVKVTHGVNKEKSKSLPVPYIEVSGEEVLKDSSLLKPIRDRFKKYTCEECVQKINQFPEFVKAVANANKISLPDAYYRSTATKCWKCENWIIVYDWPKDGLFSDGRPEKEPIPETIQMRESHMAGTSYWANTCPYCKNIQGDFFMYSEPDGAFFGFQCGKNNPKAFIRDQHKLARIYAQNYGSRLLTKEDFTKFSNQRTNPKPVPQKVTRPYSSQELLLNEDTCPRCNGKLVWRETDYGKFYGCSNFPNCWYMKS